MTHNEHFIVAIAFFVVSRSTKGRLAVYQKHKKEHLLMVTFQFMVTYQFLVNSAPREHGVMKKMVDHVVYDLPVFLTTYGTFGRTESK